MLYIMDAMERGRFAYIQGSESVGIESHFLIKLLDFIIQGIDFYNLATCH